MHEISRLTGVSVRALQYYDNIGLLEPAGRTDSGYRLYDARALGTLQEILLYRELEFPLKDIKNILRSPSFDRAKALDQQIELLTLRKNRLEDLIRLARELKQGGSAMDFSAFDTRKLKDYEAEAKAAWGGTPAYEEYRQKAKDRAPAEERDLGERLMAIFKEFGAARSEGPESQKAQALVRKLKDFITKNYYQCTDEILSGLGQMYAAGGEMTENIDRTGGEGTGDFVNQAIGFYRKA